VYGNYSAATSQTPPDSKGKKAKDNSKGKGLKSKGGDSSGLGAKCVGDVENLQVAENPIQAKVRELLPLLHGFSYGEIEYILDNVRRESTLYPITILPSPCQQTNN
jgi:hypothetical protein